MPPKKIKQVEEDDQSGSDAETTQAPSKRTSKTTPAKQLTAAQKKALSQAESESTMVDPSEPVKKARNVKSFLKQGQKKETPEELDGLRLFYESLCLEKADSEMAARWCIQHGIFDEDKHDELVQKWGLTGRSTVASTTKKDPSSESKTSTPRAKKAAAMKKISQKDDSEEDYKPQARAATKKPPTPKKTVPAKHPVKKQRTAVVQSGDDDEDDEDSSSDGEVYTPRSSSRRGSTQPPRRGKLESSDEEETKTAQETEETKTAQETTSMVDQE